MVIKHILTLGAIIGSLMGVGCSEKKDQAGSEKQADNTNKNEIVVFIAADNPPSAFYDSKTNKISGFEADFVQELARELEIKITLQDIDFGGILAGLSSNKAAFAVANISRTPDREQKVDFSVPYLELEDSIVSLESSKIEKKEELKDHRVGAQLGSSQEMIANQMVKEIGAKEAVMRNKLTDLIMELKNKNVEAVLMHTGAAKGFSKNDQSLYIVPLKGYDMVKAVVAFPKGSEWKVKVDKAIEKLSKDGVLEKLKKKWF